MIEIGLKGYAETIVNESNIASFAGSGDLPVFATPCMVALIEEACWRSLTPFLTEGQGSVGTKLTVTHDAATPIGMKVWAESVITEVDRRRLVFHVDVFDECGRIGGGEHERFLIMSDKFLAKVSEKEKKA